MPGKGFPSSPFGLRRNKGKKGGSSAVAQGYAGQVEGGKGPIRQKVFFLTSITDPYWEQSLS